MDHETSEEIKRHFNVVAEGLRSEIRTVAEGFIGTNERIDRVEERIGGVAEGLRSEIRTVAEGLRSFREEVSVEFRTVSDEIGEVKAMIRISFGQLDRRMTTLESDVASLRARVEKLEARSSS